MSLPANGSDVLDGACRDVRRGVDTLEDDALGFGSDVRGFQRNVRTLCNGTHHVESDLATFYVGVASLRERIHTILDPVAGRISSLEKRLG